MHGMVDGLEYNIILCTRLVLSSFEVYQEERGSEPTLAWSSSLNPKCCFLMSLPLDWMPTQPSLWFNCLSGEDKYYMGYT